MEMNKTRVIRDGLLVLVFALGYLTLDVELIGIVHSMHDLNQEGVSCTHTAHALGGILYRCTRIFLHLVIPLLLGVGTTAYTDRDKEYIAALVTLSHYGRSF